MAYDAKAYIYIYIYTRPYRQAEKHLTRPRKQNTLSTQFSRIAIAGPLSTTSERAKPKKGLRVAAKEYCISFQSL